MGLKQTLLICLLFLTSCDRFGPARTVDRPFEMEPKHLDAVRGTDPGTMRLMPLISEGLLQMQEGAPVSSLAETWSQKGATLIFVIRDRKWSDGVKVAPEHFVTAWKRHLSPGSRSPLLPTLLKIKGARDFHSGKNPDFSKVGVSATSGDTLEVKLAKPDATFAAAIASPLFGPERLDVFTEHPDVFTTPIHLRTVGPYVILTWERGKSMVLATNSYYPVAPAETKLRLKFPKR